MPYYHFSWIKNGVTTSWWIEEHPDDESASRRAGELEEEEVHAYRERVRSEQEKRRALGFPLIPPDDLIIW